MGYELLGAFIGSVLVALFLGWILMLVVGGIGLGWGFWSCFGIMFIVVLVANFIRSS